MLILRQCTKSKNKKWQSKKKKKKKAKTIGLKRRFSHVVNTSSQNVIQLAKCVIDYDKEVKERMTTSFN